MDAARRGVDAATACGVLPLQEGDVDIKSMTSVVPSSQLCLKRYETITNMIRLSQFQTPNAGKRITVDKNLRHAEQRVSEFCRRGV